MPVYHGEITAAEPIQRRVYDDFDLQITYHRPTHTAALRATITDGLRRSQDGDGR